MDGQQQHGTVRCSVSRSCSVPRTRLRPWLWRPAGPDERLVQCFERIWRWAVGNCVNQGHLWPAWELPVRRKVQPRFPWSHLHDSRDHHFLCRDDLRRGGQHDGYLHRHRERGERTQPSMSTSTFPTILTMETSASIQTATSGTSGSRPILAVATASPPAHGWAPGLTVSTALVQTAQRARIRFGSGSSLLVPS